MSDLVRNPEDGFSHNEAYIGSNLKPSLLSERGFEVSLKLQKIPDSFKFVPGSLLIWLNSKIWSQLMQGNSIKQLRTFGVTMAFILLRIIYITRAASEFGESNPNHLKFFKFVLNAELKMAAPVAEWVRSLYFSALNHSIISPLCLV